MLIQRTLHRTIVSLLLLVFVAIASGSKVDLASEIYAWGVVSKANRVLERIGREVSELQKQDPVANVKGINELVEKAKGVIRVAGGKIYTLDAEQHERVPASPSLRAGWPPENKATLTTFEQSLLGRIKIPKNLNGRVILKEIVMPGLKA